MPIKTNLIKILLFTAAIGHISSLSAQTDLLDLYMARMTQMKKFTGTVLLAEGDNIYYRKAFGPANAKGNIMNTTESVYRIGSITKTYTSVLILQLAEQGKLTLDDPLSKYVKNFPKADKITVKQLLTHTSGIPNYSALPDLESWHYKPITPDSLVNKVRNLPFAFQPGEGYGYSNTNYIFLGMILEQIYGDKYENIVLKQICKPAGMSHTGSNLNRKNLNLSEGLTPTRSGYASVPQVHTSVPFAAGALYSNVDDMLLFSRKLTSGGFFADSTTLTTMTTPEVDFYALGVYEGSIAGLKGFGHNGGIDGYAAQWFYFPEKDLTLITISNNMSADHAAVGETIVKSFLGEPVVIPEERKVLVLPDSTLQKYVGSYELAADFLIDITIDNGGLRAQATGQSSFELYAQSDTVFYAVIAVAEITFHPGPDGIAKALTLDQNGERLKAKRFEIKDLTIQIPIAKLERLAGTYELREGFNLEIKIEGDKLIAQASGQQPFELYAEDETRFFATAAPIDLVFEIGKDGKASSVTLDQNGFVIKAERL